MGNKISNLILQNIDLDKLRRQFVGYQRYMSGDAYTLDNDRLIFKNIKGQYLPKYTINGLDIYTVPGEDLVGYLDDSGLWSNQNINKDNNYYMVKNRDNETFSLIPAESNISNLIDFYLDSPVSPNNGFDLVDGAQNDVNTQKRINYYSNHPMNGFIGGEPDEVRRKFWKTEAIMDHAADSIAEVYGIDPAGLKNRMNYEGFVDRTINANNSGANLHGYNLLHAPIGKLNKEHLFGLDYGAYYINEGLAKLLGKEQWRQTDFINEKGVHTPHAEGKTVADNMGIMASVLRHDLDQAKSDFPGKTQDEYDIYSQAYYNRGESSGKTWVENGAKESPKNKYYYKKVKKKVNKK